MTTANSAQALTADRRSLPLPLTSMIGSLPHHNADAALEVSFRVGLPFLPQIPIRNPFEYMISQALDGLPGLEATRDGVAILHVDRWISQAHAFKEKLEAAFEKSADPLAFQTFLPTPLGTGAWQGFLWELSERSTPIGKVQIAGPITAQSALKLESPAPTASLLDLTSQIFRLVLARSIAMARKLRSAGVTPVIFLDEPGLSAVPLRDPRGFLALQELKILVQTLKKEQAWVGLHCCGDADWSPLLQTAEPDFMSIDCGRSLTSLLSEPTAVKNFIERGGRFSFGLVPTQSGKFKASTFDAKTEIQALADAFRSSLDCGPAEVKQILNEALYTPACGLAFHSPEDVEEVLTALTQVEAAARSL